MRETGCLLRMVLVSVMGFVVVWLVWASPASGASLARVPLRFAKGTGCVVLCFAVEVRASPCELRFARSRPPSRGEGGLSLAYS